MNPDKFRDKAKKIGGVTKVNIVSVYFLDPEYEIETLSDHFTSPTGFLEVVRLKPKSPELPKFIFRWDENKDALDVDIYKEEIIHNELWNVEGYEGHHTQKITSAGKVFKANISIPDKKIFEGKIDVGLFIQLTIKDSGKLTDSIKVVHKRVKIEDSGAGENHIKVNKR